MEWGWLVAVIVVAIIVERSISAWKQLGKSEKMLEKVDKSKLKNLDDDGWNDD